MKSVVGYGDEYSRRGQTRTMNAFVCVETRPVRGGADVRVVARRGYAVMPEVDQETGEATVRVRRDAGPRIGQTVKAGNRHIVVAARRFDRHGRLQVMDEDTRAWHVLDADGRGDGS